MSNLNKPRLNRKSPRKPGHDYVGESLYFVTICTHLREWHFGEVVDDMMYLNPLGQVANDRWVAIPSHFPHVQLGVHVVMPNHVHGIIHIGDQPDQEPKLNTEPQSVNDGHGRDVPNTGEMSGMGVVGTQPTLNTKSQSVNDGHGRDVPNTGEISGTGVVGTQHAVSLPKPSVHTDSTLSQIPPHMRNLERPKSGSLGAVIRSYKSAVTREIRKLTRDPHFVVWQGRYHDHIIINQKEFDHVRRYTLTNPERWEKDFYNE